MYGVILAVWLALGFLVAYVFGGFAQVGRGEYEPMVSGPDFRASAPVRTVSPGHKEARLRLDARVPQ
jgi:hypothetical protein